MNELWSMSATDLAMQIRTKTVTATDVTRAHLDRMEAVNPKLNAVVQATPDEALDTARQIDADIAAGRAVGPMAGVPVTIKVNVDQAGQATTNGLRLQADLIAHTDSPVVSNLRQAGAVIVGRTNTPAFSLRWFTKNSLHGQTLNPRDAGLTPGGSSGGAGAAVASGICAVGHGTDIAGSVRYPAYACGLHGLRPTLGRIPAWNASAPDRLIGAQLMAVSGPLCRSMADVELSLRAMMARDVRDPWWVPVPLDQGGFEKRAALCVAPDGMAVEPAVEAALHRAADALRARGWQVDEAPCPPMQPAAEINEQLWMAETYLSARDAMAAENDPDAQFVYAQMTRRMTTPDLASLAGALQARVSEIRRWQAFFADFPVLLCPVSGMAPFEQQLDVRSEADFVRVFDAQLTQRAVPALGIPGLSVATSGAHASPMGVQLLADRYREDILLAAGRAIEAELGTPQVCDPQGAG